MPFRETPSGGRKPTAEEMAETSLVRPAGYPIPVASRAADLPHDPAVVMIRPHEGSPGAFRAFVDELLAGPEPELEALGAAEALREVRADAHE